MEPVWTVLLTLVVYQAVLLGVGLWARKRSQDVDGYFIGGRNLGPWVASLSYAAGSSSAWSILGVSGIAFSQGLSSFWLLPGTLTGHLLVWFWLAPALHKLSHTHQWVTLTDLLANGLSSAAAMVTYRLAAVVVLFCFTFYVAAQFQGAATTFTAVFEFNFVTALLIGVSVVLAYTWVGGFWAVSLTDALQAGLILFAAIVLPLTALVAVGGPMELWAVAATQTQNNYWHFLAGDTAWFGIGFMLGMASIGFGPLGQPHLLNRIMALADAQHIKLARRIALTWFVAVLGGMYVLGLCAHVLLQGEPGQASEQVFFTMAQTLLPSVLTGVLIAAVLSAIMSTADSQLLVAGAAIAHDFSLGRKSRASSARVAVILVAVAATMLALWLPESIFSRVLFAWNALGAAFGPIVVCRLLGWKVRDWSVPLAMLLGFGLTVLFYTLPDGPGDLWERAVPFVTAFVTLLVARTSRG